MQETGEPEKCNVNTASFPNLNRKDNATIIDNNNRKLNYFISGLQQKADKRASAYITQKLHKSSVVYSA